MKPGAEWRLFIPSNLAYGSNGAGPLIGPDTALIFDVQLIEIVK
jgi:FKBP-type peptidyl-prolyl cis-trans isomerase FklB